MQARVMTRSAPESRPAPSRPPADDSAPSTVGSRIRRLRDRAGLRQAEVAEKVGLSRGSITNIEADRQEPTIATLVTLSGLFGVSVGVLVGTEPMPAVPPIVRIRSTFTVACEECGDLGVFGQHGKANEERQRHLREDHPHA